MRFSELEGARVGVWGAGREISSLARQLAARLPGARIAVAAFDEAPPNAAVEALGDPAPSLAVGGAQALDALSGCDVVVRSPGVSIHRPELGALRAAGVEVTTATSLWLAEHGADGVIVVTGTKGKSTTAALACHLARAAGVDALLAGNIGASVLDLLGEDRSRPVVLELSSFQIADLATGPEVAVLTNLYPEHLDWHGSFEAYRADKLRVFALPGVRTAVIGSHGAESVPDAVRTLRFGTSPGWEAWPDGLAHGGALRVRREDVPLAGEHNLLNVCAALTALEALGLTLPALPAGLAAFAPLPHRLEQVAEIDGVAYVDDSISTTPESALAALASFPGRQLVLIAGGQDRGQRYAELAAALCTREATVIGIPTTGERLVRDARAAGVPGERALEAPNLAAAVAQARERAAPGAVVLLSPAAPSYDSFRDFEERGERFRALVEAG